MKRKEIFVGMLALLLVFYGSSRILAHGRLCEFNKTAWDDDDDELQDTEEDVVKMTKDGIIRTDVNPKTLVFKNEQGKYILKNGGVYTVKGTLYGDIEGRGDIGLKIEDGTIINGQVDLQCTANNVIRKYPSNPRIWVDYKCHATINNPDGIALQAGHRGPTFIEYCGTITVNGNVSGNIQLTDGGTTLIVNGNVCDGFAYLNKETWLRVNGTIEDGVRIKAEFNQYGNEASITNSYATDGDIKVFYGGDEPSIFSPRR